MNRRTINPASNSSQYQKKNQEIFMFFKLNLIAGINYIKKLYDHLLKKEKLLTRQLYNFNDFWYIQAKGFERQ